MGWMAVYLVDLLAWWERSPTKRRPRSPHYRSAGQRLFSLWRRRVGGVGINRFEWDSVLVRCLILLSWMSSCTVGIPTSLWIISLVTDHGASTVVLNILD